LRNEGVNGCHLHSSLATRIPKICGSNVVCPVRLNQWQRCEAFNDLGSSLWSSEALEKLLQN